MSLRSYKMGKVLPVYMSMSVTSETLKIHAEMFVGAAHDMISSEKIQIAPKEMLGKLVGGGGFKCASWELNCVGVQQ